MEVDGKITIDQKLVNGIPTTLRAIFAHEYFHRIQHYILGCDNFLTITLGNKKKEIKWLIESTADYMAEIITSLKFGYSWSHLFASSRLQCNKKSKFRGCYSVKNKPYKNNLLWRASKFDSQRILSLWRTIAANFDKAVSPGGSLEVVDEFLGNSLVDKLLTLIHGYIWSPQDKIVPGISHIMGSGYDVEPRR